MSQMLFSDFLLIKHLYTMQIFSLKCKISRVEQKPETEPLKHRARIFFFLDMALLIASA